MHTEMAKSLTFVTLIMFLLALGAISVDPVFAEGPPWNPPPTSSLRPMIPRRAMLPFRIPPWPRTFPRPHLPHHSSTTSSTTAVVQGVVFYQPNSSNCKTAAIGRCLGSTPLPGVFVELQCNNTKVQKAPDRNPGLLPN